MISKAYGFQTGKIVLPGLDFAIKLLPDKFYRDDGVVPDLETHTEEIYNEFSHKREVPEIPKTKFGFILIFEEYFKIGYLTFVRKNTKLNETYAKGHESGHVLFFSKHQKKFFKNLKKKGIKLKKDNYDIEGFAHLCGLYSLFSAGYNISRIEFSNTDESLPPEKLAKLGKIFLDSLI